MIVTSILAASLIGQGAAPAPWPLARQDRYGTARAIVGPSEYSLPWVVSYIFDKPIAPVIIGQQTVTLSSHSSAVYTTQYYGLYDSWTSFRSETADGIIYRWTPAYDEQNGRFLALKPGPNPVAYAFGSTPGSDDTYPRLWTSPDLGVSGSRDPGEPAGPANIGPDGDVYVVTTRGSVFRLNGATGTVVWQRTGLGPASSMAVFTRDDQRLIVSTGRAVRALRVLDGQQVWRTQHSSTMGPPAVAPDGTIVVGDAAGDLRGLNPRTGAPRWMRSLSFPIIHPAAFGFAGEAYVPAGKRLSGVNVSNGSVLWTRELEGTAFAPIVGHDGRVYVGGGTDLVCTLPNGDLVWKNTVPVGTGPMTMDAMATLYMATGNGRLLRVGQTFYHAGRRGVSIGSASAEELRSIWTLTHQADGNALTIHGRRVASPARAFARIWLDQRQVLVPWGFGPDGARRAVPFARVRALVRATHSGPVTLRVQMVQEGRGYSDVHNRTLAPGWQWVEFTVPAEQFQTTVRPFEALLRFDGEGDVSQSTAEIDLFELAHLYTFWPEPE